jgi:phage gp36-like protein
MADYATVAAAELLYGTAYVAVACDRNLDGTLDTTSFERHLTVASRQIDGYLLGRYPLPLATVPAHFEKLCVDIAIYNAAATADVGSVAIKERNEAALKYLELIALNKVKLEIAADTTTANESATPQIQVSHAAAFIIGGREFSVDSLRRIL